MAIVALHSAATGLKATSQNIDIIANNIANTNTVGYKALHGNFEDLLYQEKQQPGVENAAGGQRPTGLFVGLGTRLSNTQIDLTQGSPVPDTAELSMLISGQGFFQVTNGDQISYTRAGNFFQNSEGDLVLGNADGLRIEPPINIPEEAVNVSISADGTVLITVEDDPNQQEVGQIELANFTNPTGLRPIGGNLYEETSASGPPIIGNPNDGSFGSIQQGFLEASNVNPVSELVRLITTQRNFEFNSQSIQAADEILEVIANLRRF